MDCLALPAGEDREVVLDKLVYTAANPVQDHLADRAHRWPGFNGLTRCSRGGRCARRALCTSSGPLARCLVRSSCRSRSPPSLDPPPR